MVTIRQAVIEDIPLIMKFIDEHWRKGDALAVNRELFEWSFARNGKVTFVIGIDDESHFLYAIQGYMPYTDDNYPDCAGTIWKSIRCKEDPLLGIHLAEFMHNEIPMRYYAGAGMRDSAIKFARLNGGVIDSMDHYYRLNRFMNPQDFSIASIGDYFIPSVENNGVYFQKISSIDDFISVVPEETLTNSVFCKNYEYIRRRYYGHPVYKYDVWAIRGDICSNSSVLITRTVESEGSYICKIIDYIGVQDDFSYIGMAIDELIRVNGYEYVDIYSYGFNTEFYKRAGFVRCTVESDNIIPNFFQPFLRKNIDIKLERPWFDGLVLFRGDGDQDRPCQ